MSVQATVKHVTDERVLLIGMMGVGKTTVGRLLAERLGAVYIDNDDLVRRRTGRGVREILEESGEDALRSAERIALTEALGVPGRTVLGVPGGIVLDPADRALVAQAVGVTLWLRARPQTIATRVRDTDRPWLGDDPLRSITALAATRDPHYADLADVVVDVDEGSPDEVAAEAERAVRRAVEGAAAGTPPGG